MNFNLMQYVRAGKTSQKQTHFKVENELKSTCILPIKLSTLPTPNFPEKIKKKQFEKVGDWYLSGTLDPHERCGEFTRALGCEDFGKNDLKHDRIIETYNCGRLGCSLDMEKVAFDIAKKSTERLFEGKNLYNSIGKRYIFRHFALSPPQEKAIRLISQGLYNHLKRDLIANLKQNGIEGGAVVFHLWRQVGEKEDLPDNVVIPKGFTDGDWYLSPHFHVFAVGFITKADEFYTKTGWVYKNLGKRTSINQLRRTIQYTLTHCALHEKHHALTYFGIFSYNKIVLDYVETKDITVPCSACGKDLHEYEIDYSFEHVDTLTPFWDLDKGIHYRKIKIKHYKLKSGGNLKKPVHVIEYVCDIPISEINELRYFT